MTDKLNVKEVVLQVEQYAASRMVQLNTVANAKFEVAYARHVDALIMEMRARLATQHVETKKVSYPADWVQAIKERFAPSWLRKHWPVRYTTRTFACLLAYPEIELPNNYGFRVALMEDVR